MSRICCAVEQQATGSRQQAKGGIEDQPLVHHTKMVSVWAVVVLVDVFVVVGA